tara:strand:+ start:434 stop:835 length:402 start_codon:yes stop_codon:yes gene_type:complete
MAFFNIYNKTKKNLNKSSFNQRNAISFNAYKLLKKYVVNGLVEANALDNAFPKNTKLKVLKNVSQRSMKTFYKLADKHIMNKHGVLSQSNKLKSPNNKKNKLSSKAKALLKLIETDSPRYERIDNLISKLTSK